MDFAELSDRYGPAAAQRIWLRSGAAVGAMRRTLAGLGLTSAHGRPHSTLQRRRVETA